MQSSDDYINKQQTKEDNQESGAEISPFVNKIKRFLGHTAVKNTLGIILAAGIVLGASAELNHMSHGSDSPEKFGDIDKSITSVTLEDDSLIRFNPNIGSDEDPNLIKELKTEQPIIVETPNGAYRLTDDNPINGSYYGISAQDLQKAIPGFNDKGDNDSICWVNVQKATIQEKDEK